MGNTKLGLVNRMVLEAKLLGGGEATLSHSQSQYMLERMDRETRVARSRVSDLEDLSRDVEFRAKELSKILPETEKAVEATIESYKTAKNSERKRRFAQKLIVQSRYKEYLSGSKKSLDTAVRRIKDAVEDAQMIYDMSQQRAKDAEIYFKLNGGIKLVGQAMLATRTQNKMPEIEYQGLSNSLTALEEEVTNISADQLLLEADRISKAK